MSRGFRPDEKITRDSLNKKLNAPGSSNLSGPRVNRVRGETVITDEEEIYIRITGAATGPLRYAWQEVYHDKATGTWKNTNRKGTTGSDPAFEINNAAVGSGSTVYTARRSRASGAWTFTRGAAGGSVDITANDVRFLALGTYDEYKDCPDVPPKPPTKKDECGTDTGVLCVPQYAGAFYVRCGYLWLKIGDTRTLQVWTSGLNGGSLPAMRRLYHTTFGGDRDPATGLPDPDSECMGVTALEYCSQGSLVCNCPACLTAPTQCLAIKFRTLPRPCPRPPSGDITCGYGCSSAFDNMDTANAWDKEFVIELSVLGCTAGGQTPDGLFEFEWQFINSGFISCDWGPDVLDPCNPCRHWGRIQASIAINGGVQPNCGGAGIWTGEYLADEICRLLCDCGEPVKPIDQKLCNNCTNGTSAFHFIDPTTIELICCPTEAFIAGGTPGSLPTNFISGGTPGSLPSDFIDGNL